MRCFPPLALLSIIALAATRPAAAQAPSGPRIIGYLQVRETWQSDTGLTASLHRVRFGLEGALPQHFSWRVTAEYEAAPATPATATATVSLRDAFVKWDAAPFSVTAGQFKTPFSWEYLTSITVLETADRSSVVDSLATKRDVGVMGQLDVGGRASFYAGVFNGEGQNRVTNHDSLPLYVARAQVRPLAALSVGANVAAFGPDSTRFGVDAGYVDHGVVLRAEYVSQARRAGGVPDHGWYALAGYRLTPWLQLIVRQEEFQRPAIGATERTTATTAGANVDLAGGVVRIIADYVSRSIGSPGVRTGELITQLQVRP